MTIKFTNNATTTLASGINSSATSLTVASGAGALFPSLSGSDVFYVTLANLTGTVEIVKVTARSSDTFTIVRGQDNTTAAAWLTGDKVELRPTAGVLNTFVQQDPTAPSTFGFKNRIINGAMQIDQRNLGASVTPTNGQYTVDRFSFGISQASKFTAQQSSTAPAGFNNSLVVTSSSAYSITSTDQFFLYQPIEGLNCADLAWGNASAATVTLSFWVRSSLTGTFGGAIANSANNRSYPFSYTINAANTWEQKSVIIAGDTTGTWLTTNGTGLQVFWSLGIGSTYSSTAGAWAAGNYKSVTGATSVVGTNGATFYITGVQLEKGSTATSFDYRPYGTELALCQRYLPAFVGTFAFPAWCSGLGSGYSEVPFQVPTRTAPTGATITGATNAVVYSSSASGLSLTALTFNSGDIYHSRLGFTVASGLVAGNATSLQGNGNTTILFTGCEL